MRHVKIAILALALGCSENRIMVKCGDPNEKVDSEFCLMFNSAILSFQIENPDSSVYSRTYSMIFLEAITGIRSRANDLHNPVYDSPELLRLDLERWTRWFKENGKNWTKKKADSVVIVFAGGESVLGPQR